MASTRLPRETAPVACPVCRELPGRPCVSQSTGFDMLHVHQARVEAAEVEADVETCSWCTTEVPDSALRMTRDGARICPECWSEYSDTFGVQVPARGRR